MQQSLLIILGLGLLLPIPATATDDRIGGPTGNPNNAPTISIIIDDIGNRLIDDSRAVGLPGPIAYAVLPQTPFAARMARLAHLLNKDVLAHIPMEAGHANHLLGPGALLRSMSRNDFLASVEHSIAAIPHAIGVSNHMGSVLTTDATAMEWLMIALRTRGLFYLDSFTTSASVAVTSASAHQVPYLRRDVFLDNIRTPTAIHKQYQRLLDTARQKGHAIAIGHPYPETIEVLNDLLPMLEREGVQLVSIRSMLEEVESWPQLSSSR